MSEWIPSEEFLKLTFPKWNGRKILAEIRKNIKSITSKTFDEGLDRVLAAAAREKDMAVLQEILPLSFNCHPLGINHLYNYRLETEAKGRPDLVYSNYSFYASFTWMMYCKFLPGRDPEFVPCVDLQGTLLHIAAHAGSLKMVKFLHQQHGGNLNATNCCGRTPLMVGVHNTEVALYLINNGCNVNHQDRWGHTVLMLTAWRVKTCKSLLKSLLAAGADPKIVDKYGKTFVHYATELTFSDNGNCIPYVIENNILDIDCQDNGSVFYAGRPIIFTHDFSSIHKAIRKMPSPSGAVFHTYLDLCELMSIRDSEKFRERLPATFKSIEDKGSPYVCAPTNALYGNRKEVTSVEEFDTLLSSSNDLRLEYLYQHLIIAERITGVYSFEAISYLREIIVHNHNSDNVGKLLCLWMKRVSMYCETYLATKSVLELFREPLFEVPRSIIESSGLTLEENKALLLEFLTSYARLTKNLAGADLHVHRYCYNPASDIAVVLYGSCYMELLNPNMCCTAAYIISYYIHQSIKGEIPQLDKGLVNDMIQSCEVHPFSNSYASGQALLIQPSTMLYSFLSGLNTSIAKDILLVCSKIFEISTVDLVNAFVPDRSTLLHFAVERDSPELFEFLLSYNAHPDAVDYQGNPPLAICSNPAIQSKLSVPNRLECITSKRVIEAGIPYRNIGLPRKVVKIINFHDKNRFYEL